VSVASAPPPYGECHFSLSPAPGDVAMFNRVLVLSASAGAGHIRAAQAVEKAFVELGAAREVRHVDTLQFTNKLFRSLYSKAYIELVNSAPDVLGWLYDSLDKPWKNE